MSTFSVATIKEINKYKKSDLCTHLCGNKPFGSRHWEYPWTVEQSEILRKKNLRILDVAPDFTFPYASYIEDRHNVTFIDLEKRKWSDSVTWGVDVSELVNSTDYRIMDVQNMSFADETFDVIFCVSVLEHIVCPTQDPDHPKLSELFSSNAARLSLREMKRCLKPGGKLLLTVDIYGGEKWKYYFDQWDIIADLQDVGFNVDNMSKFERGKIFNDPETFVSEFHGPYITLGFSLNK